MAGSDTCVVFQCWLAGACLAHTQRHTVTWISGLCKFITARRTSRSLHAVRGNGRTVALQPTLPYANAGLIYRRAACLPHSQPAPSLRTPCSFSLPCSESKQRVHKVYRCRLQRVHPAPLLSIMMALAWRYTQATRSARTLSWTAWTPSARKMHSRSTWRHAGCCSAASANACPAAPAAL